MHVEALAAHGVPVDIVRLRHLGTGPRATPRVELVDTRLARPSGLAHDPVKLASVLSDLLG